MAKKAIIIDSTLGQYTAEDISWLQKFFLQPGVLADSSGVLGLAVSQRGAGANLSVDVAVGNALIDFTKNSTNWKIVGLSNAIENVVVPTQSSGANRVGALIMRASVTVEPNVLKNNIITFEFIPGTSTSPLSDGAITTAISNDMFLRLADITVPTGAASIVTGNIADTRVQCKTNEAITLAPKNIKFTIQATDPVSPVEGQVWYNSTNHTINFYNNSTVVSLGGTQSYLGEIDSSNGATITGTTISFDGPSKEIRDSGNGFVAAKFRAGQSITVSGSASNNNTFTIVSVAIGVLVVTQTVTTEAAGASVTVACALTDKILRLFGGQLPDQLKDILSMSALEILADRDAIAVGLGSASLIGFDAKVSKISGAASGSNWSDNMSFTVGNNPNRAIIAIISCQSPGGGSGGQIDTIGGVAPTLIFSVASTGTNGGQMYLKAYRVVAPSTGSCIIAFSAANNGQARSGCCIAYSLYNVDQTTPVGANGAVGLWSTNQNQSITTTNPGAMVLGGAVQSNNSIPTSGVNIPLQQETGNGSPASGGVGYRVGLSDTIYPAGTNNFGIPDIGGFPFSFGIEIKPAASASSGAKKASANANTAPLNQLNMQDAFIGFVKGATALNAQAKVSMETIVDGFSGLIPGLPYYLQNTAGLIGLVPGTIAKFVGIALSATQLFVTKNPTFSTPIALASANGTYVAGNDGFIIAISANATSQMTVVVAGVTHSVQSSANNTQRELIVPVRKGQTYVLTNSSSSYFMPRA